MAFGIKWHQGNHGEFAIIDLAYNTARPDQRADLAQRLAAWRADDGNRPDLMTMQQETVFAGLAARLFDPEAKLSGQLRQWVGDLKKKGVTEPELHAMIDRKMVAIQRDWFSRGDADTQWIHDARLTPPEVEAVMVQAKRKVCELFGSDEIDSCEWRGQCEWPEFLVRIAVDPATRNAEIWVFGPDNRMPRDPARNTDLANAANNPGYVPARALAGRPTASGAAVCADYFGRVPTLDQEVPYLPDGPLRLITEVRWQPAGDGGNGGRPPLLALTGPIPDQAEADGAVAAPYAAELDKVQGNILKSHGRTHAAHLLLRFTGATDVARFLNGLDVTTAAEQRRQSAAFKASGNIGRLTDPEFRGFGLSAAGYRFLGVDGPSGALLPADAVFRKGMQQTGRLTFDPPVDDWQETLRPEIHAVVVLAHSHEVLDDLVTLERQRCAAAGVEVVAVERGRTLRRDGQTREPFGFADNLNQPLFFQSDVDDRVAADGDDARSQAFAPGQVLVAQDDGHGNVVGYGSYLVFRKLEQNVARFVELQEALAAHLQADRELAAAQVIGRRRDGTLLPQLPAGPPSQLIGTDSVAARHAFEAPAGSACPFSAHIRRVGDHTSRGRARVMARRGIPYDDRHVQSPEPATEGVGLLFMACVWDIAEQFVEVQAGAVAPDDPGSPDLLLGHSRRWWADPTGQRPSLDLDGEPLIRFLGGEYFFLPPPGVIDMLAQQAGAAG